MNYNEYKKASQRTINNSLNDGTIAGTNLQISHIVLGIVGEAYEVYKAMNELDTRRELLGISYAQIKEYEDTSKLLDKVYEEIGDLFFYIQWLDSVLSLSLIVGNDGWLTEQFSYGDSYIPFPFAPACELAEYWKKVLAKRLRLSPIVIENFICTIMYTLNVFQRAVNYDKSYGQIAQENVDKLKERYPKGYEAKCS